MDLGMMEVDSMVVGGKECQVSGEGGYILMVIQQ